MAEVYRITEFPNEIRKIYLSSRMTDRFGDKKIKRGRNHSVSSIVEDLVAELLYENLKVTERNLYILVDAATSYKEDGKKNKTLCYPDISIFIEKDDILECVYMCDIKMDPGYHRDGLEDSCINHSSLLVKLQNSFQVTHKSKSLDFKDCRCYDIVYISKKNGSKKFQEALDKLDNRRDELTQVYVLLEGLHPNESDDEKYSKNPATNSKQFEQWLNKIKKIIQDKKI